MVSANSVQSRADVLVIVMSAVLVLTGLQWVTLKPRDPVQVELEGEEVDWRAPGLPKALASELQWCAALGGGGVATVVRWRRRRWPHAALASWVAGVAGHHPTGRHPPTPPAPCLPAHDCHALLLRRVWDALRSASRTRSLVLFYNGHCLMQVGVAPPGMALGSAAPGPICQQAMKSGTGNYLANLVLFPGPCFRWRLVWAWCRWQQRGWLPAGCP